MAGKQFPGNFPSNVTGMSKSQLYDIMSQIKTLIEQNQQQAREILIQNPLLTKALFQAQIMLGMVQPPQAIPNIQPTAEQHPQQSVQPAQIGLQGPANATQTPAPVRKQQNQPVLPISTSADPVNLQSQLLSSHPLTSIQQPKEHFNAHSTPIQLPQSSQVSNMPPLPIYAGSQPSSIYQPPAPSLSIQMQPVQTGGFPHLPLQPPLPSHPRPPSMQGFPHQVHSQMGPNTGFQHSGALQMHHSQPLFHPGAKPPSMGPSFPQGQPPHLSQPLPQSLYQGKGLHLGTEFNQPSGSTQGDRGAASWMPGMQDNAAPQLLGLSPLAPAQMGTGNQPPLPPPLTPEMEKALLQQVMSLTPEQISLLPPGQRNQVLQLQQMLRQ